MSGKQEAGPRKTRNSRRPESGASPHPDKGAKNVRSALRSVYDDTLREAVPDDFQRLLDKLR